jgi:hypothetical protein
MYAISDKIQDVTATLSKIQILLSLIPAGDSYGGALSLAHDQLGSQIDTLDELSMAVMRTATREAARV